MPQPFFPSGLASGSLLRSRDRWPEALQVLAVMNRGHAVELTTTIQNIHQVIDAMTCNPNLLKVFPYVAVHAPAKNVERWTEVIDLLATVRDLVDTIVFHPDTLPDDLDILVPVNDLVAIENMDRRKPIGQTVDQLRRIFDLQPAWKFVLDIAHAHDLDPSGKLNRDLIDAFEGRLAHIHVSRITKVTCAHVAPRYNDLEWLARDLACAPVQVPVIWEALPTFDEN